MGYYLQVKRLDIRLGIWLFLVLLSCKSPIVHAENFSPASGTIFVEIKGFRNNLGEVRVNLYTSSKGFPSEPGKAFMTLTGNIENNESKVVFNNLPFGEYAIAVLHDENGNKKMDFNWMMMPKEGIGASNNPKSYVGPPGFNDARFRLSAEELIIKINIWY